MHRRSNLHQLLEDPNRVQTHQYPLYPIHPRNVLYSRNVAIFRFGIVYYVCCDFDAFQVFTQSTAVARSRMATHTLPMWATWQCCHAPPYSSQS